MQSNLFTIAVIVVLVFSSAQTLKFTNVDQNSLEFTYQVFKVVEGLFDVTIEGTIERENLESNKLGAFVNIAGKTFPILQSMGLTEHKLEFTERFPYDLGWINGSYGFTFEFYIGWYVTNGSAQDYEYLNVSYVPYLRGEGSLFLDADTWAYEFDASFFSKYVNIKIPISTQLNFDKNVEFCYDGNANITDPTLLVTFDTKVKSCIADMALNIFERDFRYECGFGSPILIPLYNRTDVPATFYNLITRTCITFYSS